VAIYLFFRVLNYVLTVQDLPLSNLYFGPSDIFIDWLIISIHKYVKRTEKNVDKPISRISTSDHNISI